MEISCGFVKDRCRREFCRRGRVWMGRLAGHLFCQFPEREADDSDGNPEKGCGNLCPYKEAEEPVGG